MMNAHELMVIKLVVKSEKKIAWNSLTFNYFHRLINQMIHKPFC